MLFFVFLIEIKDLKRWICYIFSFYIEKFPDSRIAWTVHWFKSLVFPTTQKLFLYVKYSTPYIAYQSSITYLFLYTLYIDNTLRACGKDSSDKKPRARLIYTSQLEPIRFKYLRLK